MSVTPRSKKSRCLGPEQRDFTRDVVRKPIDLKLREALGEGLQRVVFKDTTLQGIRVRDYSG
jgi:hypothetical protein